MARVLVIGAAGLLGQESVRALLAHGHDVVGTGRDGQQGRFQFDIELDPPAELFLQPIDLVVNCAGVLASEIDERNPATMRRAEAVNAVFPHKLAAAAEARGARLVHVSTDAVFRADTNRCLEDDDRLAQDAYGASKRRGEPLSSNAISLRCSFVGRDPRRHRGLLEWLIAQPSGAGVDGYVDQAWNGLASGQVAAVCAGLVDGALFERARAEGPVHHVFEDPPLTKYELLDLCVRTFGLPLIVAPVESGRPSTRVLGTRYAAIAEYLQSVPRRAHVLAELAKGGHDVDG